MVYRACGNQSGNGNATPAAAGGDKDPGVGDAGRVLGCRKPLGQILSGLTWELGRCGGRDGAEVVVQRNGRGLRLITGKAASRGRAGRRWGLASDAPGCCARPRGFESVQPQLLGSQQKLERSNS